MNDARYISGPEAEYALGMDLMIKSQNKAQSGADGHRELCEAIGWLRKSAEGGSDDALAYLTKVAGIAWNPRIDRAKWLDIHETAVQESGAFNALSSGEFLSSCIESHVNGDWGDADQLERFKNDCALMGRAQKVVSRYSAPNGQGVVVFTMSDRSATWLVTAEEYAQHGASY